MSLSRIGWQAYFREQHEASRFANHKVGRITRVERSAFQLECEYGSITGHPVGGLIEAEDEERPAVGDWAVLAPMGPGEAAVLGLLPRKSRLVRKRAGRTSASQILVANIDVALIAMSLNEDFNLSRLERYLAMVREGGISPIIVLTKLDLCEDLDGALAQIDEVAPGVPRVATSAKGGLGLDELRDHLGEGISAVLIGSSGVGKSTLVNGLMDETLVETGAIREADGRGKHTTTYRTLLQLPWGGVIIDTPGLRELSPMADDEALGQTFPEIEALAEHCRFRDCAHVNEPGCAVLAARAEGQISERRLDNYHTLKQEGVRLARRKEVHLQRSDEKRLSKLYKRVQSAKQRNR